MWPLPNAATNKLYRTHLLRRSFRVGAEVRHETLGNISHLPDPLVDITRRSLAGERFVAAADAFSVQRSLPHGNVQAVLGSIRKLGLDSPIASQRCRERDLVLAMVAEGLLYPCSKLATTRAGHTTTLAEELGVAECHEDDLYRAMNWLWARLTRIETKLAQRHLRHGALVLYDVSSSYYEGPTGPLARFGYDRDGQKGRPIIVYGLLADGGLQWNRHTDAIQREAALDGVYVVRTSEDSRHCSAEDVVRRCQSLAQVERAFRCLKGIDLRIRPIHHRSADHVRAHILLCMLAYYVEWHMRRSLAPLLFADEELARNRRRRDPVAPPEPSASAQRKKIERVTADGFPVHSFDTLLEILGTRCRNTCRIRQDAGDATFQQLTEPTPLQARAFELLGV